MARRLSTKPIFVQAGLVLALSAPANTAPIYVYFRGVLEFKRANSLCLDNAVPEVDKTIRALLDGSSIRGRLSVELDTPLKNGTSTASGQRAVY